MGRKELAGVLDGENTVTVRDKLQECIQKRRFTGRSASSDQHGVASLNSELQKADDVTGQQPPVQFLISIGKRANLRDPDTVEGTEFGVVIERQVLDHLLADGDGPAIRRGRRQHGLKALAGRQSCRQQRCFFIDGLIGPAGHALGHIADGVHSETLDKVTLHGRRTKHLDEDFAGPVDQDLDNVRAF